MFGSIFGGAFFGEVWRLLSGIAPPARLPDNIIVATQSVHDVKRRVAVTEITRSVSVAHARRTVTFDG